MEENLKAIREEVQNIDNNIGWQPLFLTIRNESLNYDYPCGEARAPANKMLNRYRDVSPFDHSRVVLQNGPCNYINASFVKVPAAGRNYILTQGALPQTAGHFWLMVWEQKSKAVLMLNKVIEKNQVKCHQYWPVGRKMHSYNGDSGTTDTRMEFQDVGLRVILLSEEESRHFVVRTLEIEEISTGSRREILQFHYTTWPDFGVPSTARDFLHFLQAVRDSGALESDNGPAVVHCSAGIGRSGTFCLADSCLLMMEQGIRVNVKDVLLQMRKFRMGLIQTADQLRFSYLAILEGVQQLAEGNTKFMPDFDDVNGKDTKEDEIPLAPPRITSLQQPGAWTKDEGFRKILEEGLLGDRPLPEAPSSSEEDSSDEDPVDGSSDEDTSTSKSYGLLIDVRNNDPLEELPIPEEVESLPLPLNISTPSQDSTPPDNSLAESKSSTPEATDVIIGSPYHKTNGVDEATLRRRAKTEATMEKLRDIKARQKEAEFYQRVYRSITGRHVLCLGIGLSVIAFYFYAKS